jgi:hypothetical protein
LNFSSIFFLPLRDAAARNESPEASGDGIVDLERSGKGSPLEIVVVSSFAPLG